MHFVGLFFRQLWKCTVQKKIMLSVYKTNLLVFGQFLNPTFRTVSNSKHRTIFRPVDLSPFLHVNIRIFIYLAVCTMLPHLPAPNYSMFLQLFLSFQSSSINSFSPISPLIPSAQLRLCLPRFLLPGGRHFITSFGNLPYSTLWTSPYHCSCFVLISSKRDLVTFIFCFMTVFLILSLLEIPAERRQKSIYV